MQALITVVLLVLLGFGLYYAITGNRLIGTWLKQFPGGLKSAPAVYLRRFLGVAFFYCVPLLILIVFAPQTLESDFFGDIDKPNILYWVLALVAVLLPFNLAIGSKKKTLSEYPQIRKRQWSPVTLFLSAASWIAYLFAYEWLFRGLLFFVSLKLMGLWLAILVNILLYAIVHIPKGREEVIGAIPLGIVLCIATYHTGSIWVAVIGHIILALSNEWITLYRHPDIHFIWSLKQAR